MFVNGGAQNKESFKRWRFLFNSPAFILLFFFIHTSPHTDVMFDVMRRHIGLIVFVSFTFISVTVKIERVYGGWSTLETETRKEFVATDGAAVADRGLTDSLMIVVPRLPRTPHLHSAPFAYSVYRAQFVCGKNAFSTERHAVN